MNAIAVLTATPSHDLLEFYSGFVRLGYRVFVVIDDNSFKFGNVEVKFKDAGTSLIQFDDDRATAALLALAELSRRTQVILFTHHEHVCRLAQAWVDHDHLIAHRLSVRARTQAIKTSS